MKRGQQRNTRTSRLLDRIGPVGRIDENVFKKTCIWETLNLPTYADSSTDTIFSFAVPKLFFKRVKHIFWGGGPLLFFFCVKKEFSGSYFFGGGVLIFYFPLAVQLFLTNSALWAELV